MLGRGPALARARIPASQWRSYLPEADHPEYPSGSTCGCYAQAQALRRFSGTDELNWSGRLSGRFFAD